MGSYASEFGYIQGEGIRKWVDMQETNEIPFLPSFLSHSFHKYLLSWSKQSCKPYSKGDRNLKDNKLIISVMKYNEG